ncbi:HAMP domain-containing sensor histidine kinase [Pseudorhodoferax sp. Leaf265]|uniref:sensor histidine kinase n=1 Tax=Pseudorhodoferax sp. Leaf265 TaxID=1736315 RepID=UPI0009E69B71|nr:HAMP domain-containing sensor histidine kinase [Pseudorhodoferax sp. Leaf265]
MKFSSLRWKLVRQLICLQIAVSISALFLFLGVIWAKVGFIDSEGDRSTSILSRTLQRSPDGGLRLAEVPSTSGLRSAPGWWFVADDGNERLVYGNVPDRYVKLVTVLDGADRTALDLVEPNGRPQARFERLDTPAGRVNVIVKTGAPLLTMDMLRGALLAYLFLMAPMALFTSIGFIFAVPWVVKRGLAGVMRAAERAESIDIGRRDTRLPLQAVPSEVLPLVQAANRALDRLSEGYDRQERFLAGAAHELRTPIATVRLLAESIPECAEKSALLRASLRLGIMAEHLLDLQRLRAGSAHCETVDLRALCEQVVADLAPLAIANECVLSFAAERSQELQADRLAIERALSNLVQNAIEHGGKGCSINVALLHGNAIEVTDTGPGIPLADRARVVEAFRRGSPKGRGAGLGLHLVSEIARLHGGRLKVGTTPRGGALIRLELGALAFQAVR